MSPAAPTREQAASALCRACGLCCDGTLFAWVTVTAAEAEVLRERGLPVLTREDGTLAMRQACPALSGRDCTAYGERPRPCRQFRCHQLIALEEGELDLPEALGVVAAAHGKIQALAGTLNREGLSGVVDQARRSAAAGEASEETRRALDEVEATLARNFLGRARR